LTPQRVGDAEALSSTEPKLPIVASGRSTLSRKFRIKEHKIKPATALASPMKPRIVVVSAEQAKQERDRATHAEIRPQRVPAGGLSGKRAFEALFRD
jgi:hypothetical protein